MDFPHNATHSAAQTLSMPLINIVAVHCCISYVARIYQNVDTPSIPSLHCAGLVAATHCARCQQKGGRQITSIENDLLSRPTTSAA